jgi:hypothetical protein
MSKPQEQLPNQYLADKIAGKVTTFFESEVRNKDLVFNPSTSENIEDVITFENLQIVETKNDELVKVTKPAKAVKAKKTKKEVKDK